MNHPFIQENHSKSQALGDSGEEDVQTPLAGPGVGTGCGEDQPLAGALCHRLVGSSAWPAIVLQTMREGVGLIDQHGLIVYTNPAFDQMCGYEAGELIGKRLPVPKSDGAETNEAFTSDVMRQLKDHGAWTGERFNQKKDGTPFNTYAHIAATTIEGSPYWTCVEENITSWKQAEDRYLDETRTVETINRVGQVLAAELDLHKLVQALTDAATQITTAQFGSFFYNVVNESGESYTLYTLSGIADEAFAGFPMPRNTAIFGPTFAGSGIMRLVDVKQDERYGKSSPYFGMPEGHPPVRSYLAIPVVSRSGEVLGGLFFGHSAPGVFTERHERIVVAVAAQAAIAIDNARMYSQAREAEVAHERRARAAALVADVGVALSEIADLPSMLKRVAEALVEHLDAAFARIWTLNDEENLLELKASAGMYTHLNGPHSRVPLGALKIGRIAQDQKPHITNCVIGDSQVGDQEWAAREGMVAFAGYPLNVTGKVVGVLAVFAQHPLADDTLAALDSIADIVAQGIERKRLEEALRLRADELAETDRRKDIFLAMLSHELRNPLSAIRNAVQVLEEVSEPGENPSRLRSIIGRQVNHLSRIVEDLLDVSRLTEGMVHLHRENVSLQSIIASAVETCSSAVESKGHALSVSLPVDDIWLLADSTRLQQVISNLLDNAAKYSKPGSSIWLAAELIEDDGVYFAIIRVKDNGIGIPAELLPHVFDLFTQAERSLDRSQGGLGIGLTVVRQLVELHGGTIRVLSDGPGLGSEFIVRLPALPPQAARIHNAELESESQTKCLSRILIIEDNLDAAETLSGLLQLWGHEVRWAPTGTQGLLDAASFNPDVILLDIGLPGIDGFEVARRLRVQLADSRVLLVALTGYSNDADRERTKDAGFDMHLSKPVDPEMLRKVLIVHDNNARE